MSAIATKWHGAGGWLRDTAPQLRLALRVTVAAIIAYVLGQLLAVPLAGLWSVLTAVVVTQLSVGSSVRAAVEYAVGTLGGAVYAGAVATLVPHNSEATLLVVLALAIAPLALLAALNPHFRVGPFTAVLVVVGSSATHFGPVGSAFYRVLEVALGGGTGLVVSLLLLPSRAHVLVIDAAADLTDKLAKALPDLLAGLTRPLEEAQVARIQAEIATAYQQIEAIAPEAKRERMPYLSDAPDPGPLMRALRRLRHDFIIIGRAVAVPLPPQFQKPLGPPLTHVCTTATEFLRACSPALRNRRAAPPLAAVEQALDAYGETIAAVRRDGSLRALPAEQVERIYALGFALEQMRDNFGDLVRSIGEFAQVGEASTSAVPKDGRA